MRADQSTSTQNKESRGGDSILLMFCWWKNIIQTPRCDKGDDAHTHTDMPSLAEGFMSILTSVLFAKLRELPHFRRKGFMDGQDTLTNVVLSFWVMMVLDTYRLISPFHLRS